jgi:hypothetical protein
MKLLVASLGLFALLSTHLLAESLEFDDIVMFKVEAPQPSKPRQLVLSGWCGHSAWDIESIQQKESAGEINIIITIVQKKAKGGEFKYQLTVPDGVDRVTLGEGRHVICSKK